MEFETAKSKSIYYKIALAISIIRNKPENISSKQFTQLIQFHFRESYNENKEIISQLKETLLKCKQENYLLKTNNETIPSKQSPSITLSSTSSSSSSASALFTPPTTYFNINQLSNKNNSNSANNFVNIDQYSKMKQNYDSNMDFLLNLIKLKIIGKNFKFDENTETIIESLKQFLEQIKYFFLCNRDNLLNENIDVNCSFNEIVRNDFNETNDSGINMSYNLFTDSTFNDSNESSSHQEQKQIYLSKNRNNDTNIYAFPYDSLVHALQIFLNVFQIEWLYYLRSSLLDSLNEFIEDLVRFLLESCQTSKEHKLKSECACQMLICLSGCDYLLDHIFRSILFALQNLASYLCNNSINLDDKTNNNSNILLLENSVALIESLDTIINLRNLNNYTKIDISVKNDLKTFLNTIFIQLTDKYPILAIKMAKSIQLLNIKNSE